MYDFSFPRLFSRGFGNPPVHRLHLQGTGVCRLRLLLASPKDHVEGMGNTWGEFKNWNINAIICMT